MAPPTVLAIKTSSVIRLVKEEAMYHKELVVEQQRLAKMSEDSETDEYALKQQQKVVEETKAVVPPVRQKLQAAIEELENRLDVTPAEEPEENLKKARQALEDGKKVLAQEV